MRIRFWRLNSWEKQMKFCGWKAIVDGIAQTKAMLPEIKDAAKKIVNIVNLALKFLNKILPVKYVYILTLIPQVITKVANWGGGIISGEIKVEEAKKLLEEWLDANAVDSETMRHIFRFVAGLITKKLKGE